MTTQTTNKSGYVGLTAAAATAVAVTKFHFLEGIHFAAWGHLFSAPMIVDPVSLNPAQIAATLGALVAPQLLSSIPGVSHVTAFFGMPTQIASVAEDVPPKDWKPLDPEKRPLRIVWVLEALPKRRDNWTTNQIDRFRTSRKMIKARFYA